MQTRLSKDKGTQLNAAHVVSGLTLIMRYQPGENRKSILCDQGGDSDILSIKSSLSFEIIWDDFGRAHSIRKHFGKHEIFWHILIDACTTHQSDLLKTIG
jgi:hypothetical protein